MRGQADKADKIRKACAGKLSLLEKNGIMTDLTHFSPLIQVIQEEQDKKNKENTGDLSVSIELTHLVDYILEVLNTSTRVPVPDICPKEEVVRRLQTFPSRPVIRKLGEFRKDHGNLKIREQRKMTGISRKDSPNEQYFQRK